MVSLTRLLILPLVAAAVQALNDWSKPCLSGVCSYDIPDSAGSSSGSLKVWGSPDAISDITVAAGWDIIGCSPDELAQDIRLVCNSDDSIAAGCSHLYEGSGAEGKIVRLPESCGKNAFARVARAWIPDDQSIPESIAANIVRRDGRQPQVKALALDTDFHAIDPSKAGSVSFAVQGANVKGAAADINIPGVNPRRRSRIDGKEHIERGFTNFVGSAIDSIASLDTFNVNKSETLSPFSVDQNFNLLNEQLSCPPITASLTVDVDAKANAVAALGVAASGTIVPPKVKDFSVITSLTGDINGSVTMKATASGTLDSGKLTIFEVAIPGLAFPGVLTIGPTFEVNAQATAGLDIQADTTVGLNYHFDNAQLIFPGDSNKTDTAGNAFTIGDTPLKLSVSPSVQATGNVQAHLIPSLNLKVSALGDTVGAGIFLNLDAFAEMKLSLEATAQASITVDKAKRGGPRTIGRYMPRALVAAEMPPTKSAAPVYVSTSTAESAAATSPATSAPYSASSSTSPSAAYPAAYSASSSVASSASFVSSSTSSASSSTSSASSSTSSASSSVASSAATPANSSTGDANASFGGCFTVNAGLSVNAGADADFFGLFDANTEVPLFNKTFEILQKCFGNQKRSLAVISSLTSPSFKKRAGLTCPAAGSSASSVKVADQVVQAGSIVPTA